MFRKLSLVLHPDKGGCEEKFKQLLNEYEAVDLFFNDPFTFSWKFPRRQKRHRDAEDDERERKRRRERENEDQRKREADEAERQRRAAESQRKAQQRAEERHKRETQLRESVNTAVDGVLQIAADAIAEHVNDIDDYAVFHGHFSRRVLTACTAFVEWAKAWRSARCLADVPDIDQMIKQMADSDRIKSVITCGTTTRTTVNGILGSYRIPYPPAYIDTSINQVDERVVYFAGSPRLDMEVATKVELLCILTGLKKGNTEAALSKVRDFRVQMDSLIRERAHEREKDIEKGRQEGERASRNQVEALRKRLDQAKRNAATRWKEQERLREEKEEMRKEMQKQIKAKERQIAELEEQSRTDMRIVLAGEETPIPAALIPGNGTILDQAKAMYKHFKVLYHSRGLCGYFLEDVLFLE